MEFDPVWRSSNEVAVANLDNLEPAIPSAFCNAHKGDTLVFVTNDGVPETTRRILARRLTGRGCIRSAMSLSSLSRSPANWRSSGT